MRSVSASTSDRGSAKSALSRSDRKHLFLEPRFDLALELELEVRRDLGTKLVDAAARDAERLGELGIDFRDVGGGDGFHRQHELRQLAGDLGPVIVERKGEREGLHLAVAHPGDRDFELGQHAPFADDDREIARLSAGKLDAVDAAGEIDDHPVADRRRTLHVVVARALTAQHFDGVADFFRSDVGDRAIDLDVREITDLHLRVDLEDRRELELVGGAALCLGLDPRITGDAQVLLADRIGKRRLDGVGDDIGTDLRAVLLRNHPHRHLAGPKTGHLGVPRQSGQSLIDLRLDLRDRHGHREPALELV